MESQPAISSLDMHASRSVAQNLELGVPDSQGSYYVHLADLALQSIREGWSTARKQKVRPRHKVWNRVHKSQNLPLCYEHHVDMHVSQIRPSVGIRTKIPRYVCPKRGCSVTYNPRQGYSVIIRKREYIAGDMIPRVSCPREGRLMYLAQVKLEKRNFRLWRCPQCGRSYTNWELSPA
jgi:transposase-like protein